MKTVISAKGNTLRSEFDPRFGRAEYFCVVDHENGSSEFHKNSHKDEAGGSGLKAGEHMAELGVARVVSGHFGPKAKDLLDKLEIQMVVIEDAQQSIAEISDQIKK